MIPVTGVVGTVALSRGGVAEAGRVGGADVGDWADESTEGVGSEIVPEKQMYDLK